MVRKPGMGGFDPRMTKSHGYLSVVAIGLIALVAGVGRLTAGYREHNAPPDIIRIPILLGSVGFGLVITVLTVRAITIIFLDAHPGVRPAQVAVAILGASLALVLAFVAGSVSSGG
jgi:hypothetical protein